MRSGGTGPGRSRERHATDERPNARETVRSPADDEQGTDAFAEPRPPSPYLALPSIVSSLDS